MNASTTRKACEVCTGIELSPAAGQLLSDSISTNEFFAHLREARLYADALHLAAHALPISEGIWWGSLCAWEFYRPEAAAHEAEALHAVVSWLQERSDPLRRAAESAARHAGVATPAGALALAVFFSGGSLAPAGLPEVAPDPVVAPKLLAHAVLTASREAHRTPTPVRQQQFLELATSIARVGVPWLADGSGKRLMQAGLSH
jgi:hypothetical protein